MPRRSGRPAAWWGAAAAAVLALATGSGEATRAEAGATANARDGAPPATTAWDAYRMPVAHRRLDNGLQVVVSVDRAAPVVAVTVMYRAGIRAESPGRSGLAHFFEHLMFQGTAALDKREYARAINGVGGRFNGATRMDYASYYTAAPSHALDLLLWIEADRMRGLSITPAVLENQRAVVLEEIRQAANQPFASLDEQLQRLAFARWENAHNGYGEVADLEAATLDDMRAFYDRLYVPSNAVLVVVGDCDPERVFARATEYFGDVPAVPAPRRTEVSEQVPAMAERSAEIVEPAARGRVLAIGYRLPPRMSKPFLSLALLDTLLGRNARGLLSRTLVQERALATSVAASFHALGNDFDFDGPMLYTVRVDQTDRGAAADVIGVVDAAIGRIQREGISDNELAEARRRYVTWFLDQVAGPGNPHQTRGRMLAAFALFDDNPEDVNRVLPEVMALTAADLQSAARSYLAAANRVWIQGRPR